MAKENGVNLKDVAAGMREYELSQAAVEKAQKALEEALTTRSAIVKAIALKVGKLGPDGKYRGQDLLFKGQRFVPMQRRERAPEDAGKDWKPDPAKTTWYFRRDADKPEALNVG